MLPLKYFARVEDRKGGELLSGDAAAGRGSAGDALASAVEDASRQLQGSATASAEPPAGDKKSTAKGRRAQKKAAAGAASRSAPGDSSPPELEVEEEGRRSGKKGCSCC